MHRLVSIYELIKGHRYEISIFTTYSVTFSFYEHVILPHLLANGCHRNFLIVDAGQCAAAMSDPISRPLRAGQDYYLLPIRGTAAFHPKIGLLLGRTTGAAFVGSHNMTVQGFGINRELTNLVEYGRDKTTLPIFQDMLTYLSDWTGDFSRILPESIEVMAVRFCPWLSHESAPIADCVFLGSAPTRPPLWDQLREHLPKRVINAKLIGPFFDADLAFLKELSTALAPRNLVVGVDPETVAITPKATKILPKARFVDARGIHDSTQYLHAKALLLETDDKEFLVTGSANPTRPAWLDAGRHGNGEAVLLRVLPSKSAAVTDLGLRRLDNANELSRKDWLSISQRKQGETREQTQSDAVFCAIETRTGFEVFGGRREPPLELVLVDNSGRTLATLPCAREEWPEISITAPLLKNSTALIDLRSKSGTIGHALVHHLRQLQAGSGSVQRDIQRHLANLQGADADIESLLGLVSRVIFDRPIEVADKSTRKAHGGPDKRHREDLKEFSTFSVDLEELAQKELKNEVVALGDLGEILDVLIRVLGQGIATLPSGEPPPQRNEEELVDTEDETLTATDGFDPFEVVEACSRKVGTLFSRMRKRLEASVDNSDEALRSLCQLAAVLGTIYVLRTSADRAPWVPRGCSLVPREKSRQFVHGVTDLLYGSKGLIASVIKTMRNDIAEVSQVRALMLWLAWDCGMDARRIYGRRESDIAPDDLEDLESLLRISPDALPDDDAKKQALNAICSGEIQTEGKRWIESHLEWGRRVFQAGSNPKQVKGLKRTPIRGDIAFVRVAAVPSLSVVVQSYHDKVTFCNAKAKKFASKFVTIIDLHPR